MHRDRRAVRVGDRRSASSPIPESGGSGLDQRQLGKTQRLSAPMIDELPGARSARCSSELRDRYLAEWHAAEASSPRNRSRAAGGAIPQLCRGGRLAACRRRSRCTSRTIRLDLPPLRSARGLPARCGRRITSRDSCAAATPPSFRRLSAAGSAARDLRVHGPGRRSNTRSARATPPPTDDTTYRARTAFFIRISELLEPRTRRPVEWPAGQLWIARARPMVELVAVSPLPLAALKLISGQPGQFDDPADQSLCRARDEDGWWLPTPAPPRSGSSSQA